MNRMWNAIIRPVFDAARVTSVVEVGSDYGKNTINLISYVKEKAGTLAVIDTCPKYDADEWEKANYPYLKIYKDFSLSRLPMLEGYDAILLDGDHNWYTVYNELQSILLTNSIEKFPLVILHDTAWPYGRRDMYYDPDTIPEGYRSAYKKQGIRRDSLILSDEGFNAHLCNSIYVNNPRNGVMTAIEDFLRENPGLFFWHSDCLFGIAIISSSAIGEKISTVLESAVVLNDIISLVEDERLDELVARRILSDVLSKKNSDYDALVEDNVRCREAYEELRNEGEQQLLAAQQCYTELNASYEALKSEKDRQVGQIEMREREMRVAKMEAEEYRVEAERHFNSIRYRAGTALFEAMTSWRKFFGLPRTLFRLYREYKNKDALYANDTMSDKRDGGADTHKERSVNFTGSGKIIAETNYVFPKVYPSDREVHSDTKKVKMYSVAVVVCVHNALDDVMECLISLWQNRSFPYSIILVDDGSDEETAEYLRQYRNKTGATLYRNEDALGYTRSANIGMKLTNADFVVLLNSDTIVTSMWIEKMVEAFEKDPQTGILSPLSNAASFQSYPVTKENGDFKVNALPDGVNLEMMGMVVSKASKKICPEVLSLNGFCFMIRRDVIDSIGYLDEESFPRGYGEEVDYGIRATKAGFKLRVLDNVYIFHEKSKSFTHSVRRELSGAAQERLLSMHGEAYSRISKSLDRSEALEQIRNNITAKLSDVLKLTKYLNGKTIAFILQSLGGGGGSNSVCQEVEMLNRLGIKTIIFNRLANKRAFEENYPEIKEHTRYFRSEDELIRLARNADIVVATAYNTVNLLKKIISVLPQVVPAYYIQDYEPYFFEENSAEHKVAVDSYELIEGNLMFAKTDWIVDEVYKHHKKTVARVVPSINVKTYNPFLIKSKESDSLTIVAMIRPETSRRNPKVTAELLLKLKHEFSNKVEIEVFGCDDTHLRELSEELYRCCTNHGVLKSYEVRQVLLTSDVFIDMSTYQAFGRTGIESMCYGNIAVLPKIGGVYQYANDGVNAIVVDTEDVNSAFERIAGLISNKDLLIRMRKNAIMTAREYNSTNAAWSEIEVFADNLSKRKNLFILCPEGADLLSSFFVRIYYPIMNNPGIQRAMNIYKIQSVQDIPVDDADGSVLLISRNNLSRRDVEEIKEMRNNHRIAVIYESDDDLSRISVNHPSYKTIVEKQRLVQEMINDIDYIIATDGKIISHLHSKAKGVVIPNYANDMLISIPTFVSAEQKTQLRVLYQGTYTHDEDLALLNEVIPKVNKRLKKHGREIVVDCIGGAREVPACMNKRNVPAGCSVYPKYIEWLSSIVDDYDFAVAPLSLDNELNYAKSYLKYLEYSSFGIPGIFTDINPYRRVVHNRENGLLIEGNNIDLWVDAFVLLALDDELRSRIANSAILDIKENHLLSTHYHLWTDVICKAERIGS